MGVRTISSQSIPTSDVSGEGDRRTRWRVALCSFRTWIRDQIDRERRARSAFVLFPIGMMSAIAAVYVGGLRPPIWVDAVLLIAGLIVLLWRGSALNGIRFVGLFAAGLAVGAMACKVELARTDTVVLSGNATVRIAGTVLMRERDERGRYRYTIDIASTERPVLSRPPGRARIMVSSKHEPLEIGDTYIGLVRLSPPAGPAFPGAYDFAYAPYFGGLGAYGFSLGAPTRGPPLRSPQFADRVAALRLSMGDTIRRAVPGPTGTVAAALITGERAGIPERINDDLRVTGLAHILSISGYHMALVAGIFMLAVRALAALIPGLSLLVGTKKIAAVVSLGATTFYFLLSGDNAATERSYIMIAVMLGAVLLDRPALTLRNVAIAAIIVMVLSPHVVLTATFQMSFAATAALVGAYGAYSKWQSRKPRNAGKGIFSVTNWALILFGMALSSAIAGAATAPFAVFHFQRGAPFALLANILAAPLFSFWIMPLAMIAVLLMPFGLQDLPLQGMGVGLDIVFAMMARLADMFPDYPTGIISSQALLLWTAAILVLSFSASKFRWLCVPLTLSGFLVCQPPEAPELLVFESGKELAMIDSEGALQPMRQRPASFVWDQWLRAFPNRGDSATSPNERPTKKSDPFSCKDGICRSQTRSGLRIAWSDDYRLISELCRDVDLAIVARAVVAEVCDNGTPLVTLRTLRRSGSLAISRSSEAGALSIRSSMDAATTEWNAHRLAPWPEYWRKVDADGNAASKSLSDSGGSNPPDDPAP